jgi:rare lipoprotein A (peptidoglycan hydrolase)
MLGKGGGEQDTSAPDSAIQTRLDELETQQKESTQPQALGAIPDSALKKFEALNQKFEKALDFLLKKQKEVQPSKTKGSGRPNPPTLPGPQPSVDQLSTDVPQDVNATGQTVDVAGGISYYGPGFEGNETASGTIFDPDEMTAAHKTLPFGTLLRVTNKDNNKSVVVRVTDRGPFVGDRSLDLSEGAMRALGGIGTGVLRNATIEVVEPKNSPPPTPSAQAASEPEPVDPNGSQSNVRLVPPPSKDVARSVQSTPNLIALGLPPKQSRPAKSMADNGGNPSYSVSTRRSDNVFRDSTTSYLQVLA